jgi:hypothetical protein
MPEQLHDPQVGATLQEVRRERMAERVRADPVGEPGAGRRALDRGPGLLAGQAAAAIAKEERAATRRRDVTEGQESDARAIDPARKPVEGDVPHRHESLLVALADDPHEGPVDRQVVAIEPDRLADPRPAA